MSKSRIMTKSTARARFAFAGNPSNGQLSFPVGAEITVCSGNNNGWLEGYYNGQKGWLPVTHVVAAVADNQDASVAPFLPPAATVQPEYIEQQVRLLQKLENEKKISDQLAGELGVDLKEQQELLQQFEQKQKKDGTQRDSLSLISLDGQPPITPVQAHEQVQASSQWISTMPCPHASNLTHSQQQRPEMLRQHSVPVMSYGSSDPCPSPLAFQQQQLLTSARNLMLDPISTPAHSHSSMGQPQQLHQLQQHHQQPPYMTHPQKPFAAPQNGPQQPYHPQPQVLQTPRQLPQQQNPMVDQARPPVHMAPRPSRQPFQQQQSAYLNVSGNPHDQRSLQKQQRQQQGIAFHGTETLSEGNGPIISLEIDKVKEGDVVLYITDSGNIFVTEPCTIQKIHQDDPDGNKYFTIEIERDGIKIEKQTVGGRLLQRAKSDARVSTSAIPGLPPPPREEKEAIAPREKQEPHFLNNQTTQPKQPTPVQSAPIPQSLLNKQVQTLAPQQTVPVLSMQEQLSMVTLGTKSENKQVTRTWNHDSAVTSSGPPAGDPFDFAGSNAMTLLSSWHGKTGVGHAGAFHPEPHGPVILSSRDKLLKELPQHSSSNVTFRPDNGDNLYKEGDFLWFLSDSENPSAREKCTIAKVHTDDSSGEVYFTIQIKSINGTTINEKQTTRARLRFMEKRHQPSMHPDITPTSTQGQRQEHGEAQATVISQAQGERDIDFLSDQFNVQNTHPQASQHPYQSNAENSLPPQHYPVLSHSVHVGNNNEGNAFTRNVELSRNQNPLFSTSNTEYPSQANTTSYSLESLIQLHQRTCNGGSGVQPQSSLPSAAPSPLLFDPFQPPLQQENAQSAIQQQPTADDLLHQPFDVRKPCTVNFLPPIPPPIMHVAPLYHYEDDDGFDSTTPMGGTAAKTSLSLPTANHSPWQASSLIRDEEPSSKKVSGSIKKKKKQANSVSAEKAKKKKKKEVPIGGGQAAAKGKNKQASKTSASIADASQKQTETRQKHTATEISTRKVRTSEKKNPGSKRSSFQTTPVGDQGESKQSSKKRLSKSNLNKQGSKRDLKSRLSMSCSSESDGNGEEKAGQEKAGGTKKKQKSKRNILGDEENEGCPIGQKSTETILKKNKKPSKNNFGHDPIALVTEIKTKERNLEVEPVSKPKKTKKKQEKKTGGRIEKELEHWIENQQGESSSLQAQTTKKKQVRKTKKSDSSAQTSFEHRRSEKALLSDNHPDENPQPNLEAPTLTIAIEDDDESFGEFGAGIMGGTADQTFWQSTNEAEQTNRKKSSSEGKKKKKIVKKKKCQETNGL